MTKLELEEIVDVNTVSLENYYAIMTAVEAYSSASNNGKPDVIGSACPVCNSPIKYNSYNSGLPIEVCSNIDCGWAS